MPATLQWYCVLDGQKYWFLVKKTAEIFAAKYGLKVQYQVIK